MKLIPSELLSMRLAVYSALVLIVCGPACRQSNPAIQSNARSSSLLRQTSLTRFPSSLRNSRKQSGIKVVLSFGGTADLAKQIENGAPFDVFAAADVAHVSALAQKGLITAGTVNSYARGSLVIWMPAGGKIRLERVEDLEQTSDREDRDRKT